MATRASVVLVLLITTAVAGCADDSGSTPITTEEALSSGLGIIEGVLVDDRFRPLELTDEPQTEFQAEGFILVQETGDQFQTTANGEFLTPPLEPGRYTLRATVEGHEIPAQRVQVEAGERTEVSLVASRLVSVEDLVLTFDFSMFIPCAIGLVATNWQPNQCTGDLSGDTNRYRFTQDLTGYEAGRFLVTETLLNHEASSETGTFEMQITGTGGGTSFATKFITEGQYDRLVIEKGADPEWVHHATLEHGPWHNDAPTQWVLWNQGRFYEELASTGAPAQSGIGPQFGTKASVLASLMFTGDAQAAQEYCGLCGA